MLTSDGKGEKNWKNQKKSEFMKYGKDSFKKK